MFLVECNSVPYHDDLSSPQVSLHTTTGITSPLILQSSPCHLPQKCKIDFRQRRLQYSTADIASLTFLSPLQTCPSMTICNDGDPIRASTRSYPEVNCICTNGSLVNPYGLASWFRWSPESVLQVLLVQVVILTYCHNPRRPLH